MEQKGIDFSAVPQTAIKVLTSPAGFFREMPKTGGFVDPLIFAIIMGVAGGLIQAVFGIIGLRLVTGIAMAAGSIILMPVFVVIGSFIGATIMFVIWKLMGSEESYETAFRCGAYTSAVIPITTLLSVIPYIGPATGIALVTFITLIASVEVHKIPSQKAWLVFGIIGGILVLTSISAEFAAKSAAEKRAIRKQAEEMHRQADEMKRRSEEMRKKAEEAGMQNEQMQKQMEIQMQKQSEDAKAAGQMQKK